MNNVFTGEIIGIRKKHQVTGAQTKSAAMSEQISNGEIFSNVWIIHFKLRNEISHFIFPFEFAFIHQHRQCSRSKCLAVGCNAE